MKLEEVRSIPGVNDLWSLLSFLENRQAREEYLAKIEKARKEINTKFEKMRIASKIEGKERDVERLENEAKGKLEDARAQAKTIVIEAGRDRDAAGKLLQDAAKREKASLKAEEAFERSRSEAEKALAAREAECEKMFADASAMMAKAEQMRDEMRRKKDALREFSASI